MSSTQSFGSNIAFIEELFEKVRHDPASVSESWREFFQDYEPPAEETDEAMTNAEPPAPSMASWAAQPATAVATAPAPPVVKAAAPPAPPAENLVALRGA